MKLKRRSFLKNSMIAGAGIGFGGGFINKVTAKKEFMSGIQIAPFNFFDEGIERVFDRLDDLAGGVLWGYDEMRLPGLKAFGDAVRYMKNNS